MKLRIIRLSVVTFIMGIGAMLLASSSGSPKPNSLNKAVNTVRPSAELVSATNCGSCVSVGDESCNACHMNCEWLGAQNGCFSCTRADTNGCSGMIETEYVTTKSGRVTRLRAGYKKLPQVRDHDSRAQEAIALGCQKFNTKYGPKK